MPAARILGVGVYLPRERVTNEELGRLMAYDVAGYLSEKRIGVRFRAAPYEATSDLAVAAAKEALRQSGLQPADIDLIILATDTPDFVSPPTSALIQYKLGAKNAGAFDLNAACADETIALALASHAIILEEARYVLVIGAYAMTKWLDWSVYTESASKVLAMLFSDGAGAVVLGPSEKPGFLKSKILAEGEYWDTYGIYLGTACPPTLDMIQKKKHFLRFHENGHRVPKDYNATRWPKLVRETLSAAGYEPSDLNLLLTNQVEYPALEATLKALSLPPDRTHWVAEKFGYAGSASALMALYDALECGKLREGDLVAFCTSGAGFVLASALFRWV
jgi:3-oxoacyl-[acyl-carrier-protein] synthase-3